MNKKIILTDVDGVLVNWEVEFNHWMQQRNGLTIQQPDEYWIHVRFGISKEESKRFVRIFNESAHIAYLKALRDSVHYVKLLHEEKGFTFHAITSLSNDKCAQELRIMNIKRLFGRSTFDTFLFTDTGGEKDDLLSLYKDTNYFWVEDKPANAVVGAELGLRSLLMDHKYNQNFQNDKVLRVSDWRSIYQLIG